MDILIRSTPAEVAVEAANIFAHYANAGSTLGLATGSTPVAMYKELIARYERGEVSFARSRAFLLDEYIGLERTHEQSYYSTIRREFTSHVDFDDDLVKSPAGDSDDPATAAATYDKAIRDAGGVDIQLLGIGANGHVGFNEPSSSLTSRTHVTTLHPQTVNDNSRFFDTVDEVPRFAVTQGLGTISEARRLLLLATGSNKANAVRDMVEGPLSAHCPASILQLHQHATVIVDESAASQLEDREYYIFADQHRPHRPLFS
ncbi:glucosamine-6-phosphate deaminase [Corynebacterium hiratae]|uniref:Glucosamine-6-phosphate deaminase n=1 Tax=Corynebacterium aurimucosum TaxID=169292 RepID=A0A6I3KFB6_9CORY|nr:glucosamine-6-phosphate deaminase [Corynebacterium aurimucosum]MTD92332.1 glucosamine-6-phosphate deaminase [Corynebacterium aurimucosum]